MRLNSKIFLTISALSGFIATCLGAFGAHALKLRLSVEMLSIYQTAVTYQFYHALALLCLGLMLMQHDNKYLKLSGIMFAVGIIIFSGSLYILALTGIKQLGAITPVGGLAFLLGWLMLGLGVNKIKTN